MNVSRRAVVLLATILCSARAAWAETPRSPHDVTGYGVVVAPPPGAKTFLRAGLRYSGDLKADVTLPSEVGPASGARWPAVVFVNGIGGKLNEWEIYRSWARLVAAHGMVGITAEAEPGKTGESLRALMSWLEREGPALSIDPSRLGVWACSANVTLALPYLMTEAPKGVKAAVVYYGNGPVEKLRGDLPLLYVLAGRDGPALNEGIRAIFAKAIAQSVPWTMVTAPRLTHAFDALDEGEESRRVVRDTVRFLSERLAPADPGPVPSLARRALTHVYGAEPEQAAAVYREILQKDPSDAEASRLLGTSLFRAGKGAESLPYLEQATKEPGAPASAFLTYGQVLAGTGDVTGAMPALRKAVEMGLPGARVWGGLGIAQLQSGRLAEAVDVYEKALAAGVPEGPDGRGIALYNLSCAYARMGRKAEALDRLARAVETGFGRRADIEADTDFASLTGDPRFKEILAKAKP